MVCSPTDLLLLVLAEQLHDGGAVLGVVERGDVAARLVDHEVLGGLGAVEQLAVDADVVAREVGAGAELGDDLAVDLHAAFEDDLPRRRGGWRCRPARGSFAGGRRWVRRWSSVRLHAFIIACLGDGENDRPSGYSFSSRVMLWVCAIFCRIW